jgi:hypothetical protein
MPDFRLELIGTPDLVYDVWTDPPSATRPARVVGINDRQFRQITAELDTVLRVDAIRDGQTVIQTDAVVGSFSMWPIEWPTVGGPPVWAQPIPGTSARQEFTLGVAGHYTFAVRHNDTSAGIGSASGGAIIFHIEVTP